VLELETVSAQDDNGSVRVVWPQPWARRANVSHQTKVVPVIHLPTMAVVMLPPGLSSASFRENLVD
jgi:hypothetical protein